MQECYVRAVCSHWPLAPPLLQVQSLEDSPVSACLPLRVSACPVLVPVLRHGGHAVVHGGQFQTGTGNKLLAFVSVSVCACATVRWLWACVGTPV